MGLLTLTPGHDTALILRTATIQSARSAWGVVLGIRTGTLAWGMLASAGISALLTASQVAYEVVRWAGVAYLLGMGARMLLATWRREPATPGAAPDRAAFLPGRRRGLLTNLLNPRMGAFHVALPPQFIPAGADPLLHGVLPAGVHVVLGLAWSTVLVSAARRRRDVLRRPRTRRVLDRITGLVVVGFGVRLATENR